MNKKAILASMLLLSVFLSSLAVTSVSAAEPQFTVTATPVKDYHYVGQQAQVKVVLTYSALTAAKYVDLKVYNGTHLDKVLGQIRAVAGTSTYSNTTTYNLPANATNIVGQVTYILKAIENTTGIVVAQATFVVQTAAQGYVLSIGFTWTDANANNILDANEPVQFTFYVTYSFVNVSKSVTFLVAFDSGSEIPFYNGTLTAGSGTATASYSSTFDTEGAHAVLFKVTDSGGKVLGSKLIQLQVGAAQPPTGGTWLDTLATYAIPIAIGFGVLIVLLLFYIARKKR